MSHFVVIVIGNNVEGQLAPYDEQITVAPYIRHAKKDAAKLLADAIAKDEAMLADSEAGQKYNIPYITGELAMLKAMTADQYWTERVAAFADEGDFDEEGNVLSTYNSNSKWDWYEIGGRWDGYFLNSYGQRANQVTKADWDIEKQIEQDCVTRLREYDEMEEGLRTVLYGGKTREQVIADTRAFAPFAFVLNGRWHERGDMGWFGCVRDEKDPQAWRDQWQKAFESLPDNTLFTAVDCHI